MFFAYVKYQYPHIATCFLQPAGGFVHSCHLGFSVGVLFVMLVTYTAKGRRLSCTEYKSSYGGCETVVEIVKAHIQVVLFSS